MRIIVVANQKGGSGKTTLCRNLAVALGGRTVLIDRDPQGTLTSWWNRRTSALKTDSPPLVQVSADTDLPGTLAELERGRIDTVLIDTPPAANGAMRRMLDVASFVLIPVRATADDIDAVQATVAMAESIGRPYGMVLTQVKARTKLPGQAREALGQLGRIATPMVFDRVEYANAGATGHGVTEGSATPGGNEIREIMDCVNKWTRKGGR